MPLAETAAAVAALDGALRKDAAARVAFELKKCPSCDAHYLKLTLANFTADKKGATTVVAKIDKTESTTKEAT